MNPKALTIVAGVAVGAIALGAGFALRQAVGPSGTVPVTATELGGPFSLTDHTGGTITEAALEGQTSLLFFGFTRCPEICPTTVYDIETWLSGMDLPDDAVEAFFVSVDPEYDTPELLSDYLTAQSDRITGITGSPEGIRALADSWSVYYKKRPIGEGEYTVDHYASVFVLNEAGLLVDLIPYGQAPEEARATIRRAMGSS